MEPKYREVGGWESPSSPTREIVNLVRIYGSDQFGHYLFKFTNFCNALRPSTIHTRRTLDNVLEITALTYALKFPLVEIADALVSSTHYFQILKTFTTDIV